MRKIFISLTTFCLIMFVSLNIVNASGFEMKLESDKDIVKPGETIVLTASIQNIDTPNEGIDLLLASISYDNNVFDVNTVFVINNKRYICEYIEYKIDERGRAGAWTGKFYPIKISDTETYQRWILSEPAL